MPIMPVLPQTIAKYLVRTSESRANAAALGSISDGQMHWRTWREVATDAATLAAQIQAVGIAPGDRVAHVSENRYEWIITDLALHLAGAVHVPIHTTLSGQQIAEQITDCAAKLALVSSEELLAKFATYLDRQIPVWLHDDRTTTLPTPTSPFPAPRLPPPASSSLATILYTSGTTGRPRGVMLSHHNLACNAATVCEAHGVDRNHTLICVLPLSHIYARTCDLYTWIVSGSRLVLVESRETLTRDCQLAQPTALNAVPFVYQHVMEGVRKSAATDHPAALRSAFGPQMKMLFCGGAPVAPDVEAWYAECGLPLLTGYGMTEASPVVAVSTCRERRIGTVGPVLPGVEVRIADDGEILVRGPNIMLGYWQDQAATADAIRDGWYHSGDLGELDPDGFLTISGRKTELIVLSTGKKVSPTRIEALLAASPLIDQAAVFGDGQCGLVALIVPSACGLAESEEPTGGYPARSACFTVEINRCLKRAAYEEQIHRFALLDRPFSVERGELTAKMSLCRNVIAGNFATELERLERQQPVSGPRRHLPAHQAS